MTQATYCRREGKVSHPSKGMATAHLRSLKKRLGYSGQVYACIHCFGWHVGRRLRTEARRDHFETT